MLVIGVLAGRFFFVQPPAAPAGGGTPSTFASKSPSVAAATAALADDPRNPALLTSLGLAYLSQARRTADPTFYARSAEALAQGRAAAPDDLRTLTASGLVALARHDFLGALDLGTRASAIAPKAVDPLGVIVDAQVELGRYDDAARTASEMAGRRPNLASLSRISYVAELRGDGQGALDAMQQAVAAGGSDGADVAYVLALLGDLQLAGGDLNAADAAYARSLAAFAGQPQAELGRAKVLTDRGDLAGAADVLRALTTRLPLPDAVALYGDVLRASGDATGAAQQYQLVRAIEELNRTQGGISVDLEVARFEAAHARDDGATDPDRAVALATTALAARPTIYGEDILGWALRQAGRPAEALPHAQAAVRLGTQDATLWWHLAAIESDLGHDAAARGHLQKSRSISPYLPLTDRSAADALAARLE